MVARSLAHSHAACVNLSLAVHLYLWASSGGGCVWALPKMMTKYDRKLVEERTACENKSIGRHLLPDKSTHSLRLSLSPLRSFSLNFDIKALVKSFGKHCALSHSHSPLLLYSNFSYCTLGICHSQQPQQPPQLTWLFEYTQQFVSELNLKLSKNFAESVSVGESESLSVCEHHKCIVMAVARQRQQH